MATIYRILDANANRAREAMRVMEEAARFLLNDAGLSQQLKQLRHDLTQALSAVPQLTYHRDTPGDVGTAITTEDETTRQSTAEVVIAAGKRLSEALRAMEEYGKTLPEHAATLAATLEQLRYRAYTLEQTLIRRMGSGRRQQWKLCLLLSESLCRHDWRHTLTEAIKGGVDCVQLREKQMPDDALLDRAMQVVAMCHERQVSVVVNDRPDMAMLSEADGVHLGQNDLPYAAVRRMVGRQLLIGVSTSQLEQARVAYEQGADYVGLGPMFPTTTKHKPTLAGPAYLRQYLAADIALPHLAIGGINADNMAQLIEAGVKGIAVSAAICNAEDPAALAQRLCEAMQASCP